MQEMRYLCMREIKLHNVYFSNDMHKKEKINALDCTLFPKNACGMENTVI